MRASTSRSNPPSAAACNLRWLSDVFQAQQTVADRQVSGAARGAVVAVRRNRSLGDAHLVDLVGAVGETRPSGVLEHVRQWRVGAVAERAVHLDAAVDDSVQHVGHEVFRHRDLALEVRSAYRLGTRHAAP